MPRFGIFFNIENLFITILELVQFKKLIGTKRPIIAMMRVIGIQKDSKLIERYLYTYGIGYVLNQSIREYNKKYKDCAGFINFDQHWSIARYLYEYIVSGRATTGNEAIRYYDLQKHREKWNMRLRDKMIFYRQRLMLS